MDDSTILHTNLVDLISWGTALRARPDTPGSSG
jgi:hypothetical protein